MYNALLITFCRNVKVNSSFRRDFRRINGSNLKILTMATAKSSIQRRLPDSVIDKGLEESLPIGVQKSYFMLTETERNMLNSALEKYRPGQSEPILVGGQKVLKAGFAAGRQLSLGDRGNKRIPKLSRVIPDGWMPCRCAERKIRKSILRSVPALNIYGWN